MKEREEPRLAISGGVVYGVRCGLYSQTLNHLKWMATAAEMSQGNQHCSIVDRAKQRQGHEQALPHQRFLFFVHRRQHASFTINPFSTNTHKIATGPIARRDLGKLLEFLVRSGQGRVDGHPKTSSLIWNMLQNLTAPI